MVVKVIHIWNTAGVAGLLCRYMDRYFDYSSVNICRKGHDPFNLNNEKCIVWDNRASIWLIKCALKSMNFDIIHLHGGIQWLKYFRFLYPKKKIVLHLHGSKIRNNWDKYNLNGADAIIVSTPDLLEGSPDGVYYLPNLVDEDLILSIRRDNKLIFDSAYHVERFASDIAKVYGEKYNLNVVIHNRDINPLDHEVFLVRISMFKYYIDVKRGFPYLENESKTVLEALSLTGLEALKLGLNVINWNGDMIKSFPKEHGSQFVCYILNKIYISLFDGV